MRQKNNSTRAFVLDRLERCLRASYKKLGISPRGITV